MNTRQTRHALCALFIFCVIAIVLVLLASAPFQTVNCLFPAKQSMCVSPVSSLYTHTTISSTSVSSSCHLLFKKTRLLITVVYACYSFLSYVAQVQDRRFSFAQILRPICLRSKILPLGTLAPPVTQNI